MILGLDAFSLRFQGWTPLEIERFSKEKLSLQEISYPFAKYRDASGEKTISKYFSYGPLLQLDGSPRLEAMKDLQALVKSGARKVTAFLLQVDATYETVFPLNDQAIDFLRRIAGGLNEVGVSLSLENHRYMSEDNVGEMLDVSPHIGFCYDVGNPIACADDPLNFLEIAPSRIEVCHIKDAVIYSEFDGTWWWRSVPLGAGVVPVLSILERLEGYSPETLCLLEISTSRAPERIKCDAGSDPRERISWLPSNDKLSTKALSVREYADRSAGVTSKVIAQERQHLTQSVEWFRHSLAQT